MSSSSSTTSSRVVASRRLDSEPLRSRSTTQLLSHLVSSRVLVIDNYDSFTYNLVQYLGELAATPLVHRHDALGIDELVALEPDAVLISPGPGDPDHAGLSNEVITAFAGRVPVLGVCLGHQCIGQVYGGRIVRAAQV